MKKFALALGLVFAMAAVLAVPAQAARYMESLNRGVVAVYVPGSGVYVGWRMFGTDPAGISFNVYRSGVKITGSPITTSTNYMDSGGSTGSTYYVRPVIGGVEQDASETVNVWTQTYGSEALRFKDVPIQRPADVTRSDGTTRTYSANDCSAGDLDGDGEFEIVLKWDPNDAKDNSQKGVTGNVYLDAYKMNGTMLWRIDLGINIRAGAHYTQFMVWDLDGDGRAEVSCKTAPGTKDGLGNYVLMGSDSPTADYRNSDGYILTGPEYYTIFNGQTGANMATIAYPMPRGNISDWGDSYGNRGDRYLACVAYLDGERPSLVECRGYYGPQSGYMGKNQLTALDWRNGQLTQRWQFTATINTGNDIYPTYIGQGNHGISVIDADGDDYDEIIYGACVIDHDGSPKFTTGLGHGDAMHVSDLDPCRPGYEVYGIHEGTSNPGAAMYAAENGTILWKTPNTDVGRGAAADIDPAYPGMECWASDPNLHTATGAFISTSKPSCTNFVIWWDADLSRELSDADRIDKWVPASATSSRVVTVYNYGVSTNNGTKKNPCLQADSFGDWREEMVMRTNDSTALRILTPVTVTSYRIFTLMHDPVYRMGIAWQNVAYNQPPHTGFFFGNGMTLPVPLPDIVLVSAESDETIPTPDPMTWQLCPYALDASSITMTASTASDENGVEYYFDCVSGAGHDSGWQSGPVYTDTGLAANTTYQYAVRVRDGSYNRNTTGWSEARAATTYASGGTTEYQAEDQTLYNCYYETTNAGYTGDAYANTYNEIGSYVEWTVTAPSAGSYQVSLRFANGTTTNRPMSIAVNGTVAIASFDFAGTGYWYTWAMNSTSLNLLAGANTVRLTSLTSNGGPNLDRMDVTVPSVDITPPTPSPMEWIVAPAATSHDTITMTARTAGDASGVEYYFWNETVTDRSHDSGWQDSPQFTDTGLANNTTYAYYVVARDKSAYQNENDWSGEASATTMRYSCPDGPDSDMSLDCVVDFFDFAMFAAEYIAGGAESEANFNADSAVDLADLAVLADEWLQCGREPVTECP